MAVTKIDPDYKKYAANRDVISLFSGAMSLDVGMQKAGLNVIIGQDFDASCVETMKANGHNVLGGDIREIQPQELLDMTGLNIGEPFMICGGPPCQPFSTAGKRLGINDPRGSLFNTIYAVAVKSGPSVFNADSKKRQEQNFTAASKLAQQAKTRYEAYIGYCYGKKKDSGRGKPKMYQELARKRFWAELTGDEDFYIKIIGFMGTLPEKYVASYKESYNKAFNRLVREFSNGFCKDDGSIDWEKLVEFNSGE